MLSLSSFQTNENYKSIFGKNYIMAVHWLQENNGLINKYCNELDVPANEIKSIVFPEIMRYNSLSDAIEIASLSFLYTSVGKTYANFSVGNFQMKPSFAEQLEIDFFLLPDSIKKQFAKTFLTNVLTVDTEEARMQRIKHIVNIETQLVYLIAFYKICLQHFKVQSFINDDDRIRFLATCYNAGYKKTFIDLLQRQPKKFYHIGNGLMNTKYCYADISAYFLKSQQ